jgi:TRAP-type C4-dicarboxylate transport system substrate-binding protein
MKLLKASKIFTAVVLAFGAAGMAGAQEVTLKVAHFLPPGSNAHQNLILPWCEKVNKESAGKLKCQIYPAMQLGGIPAQLFDQVRDGISDITWTVPTYQAGRFIKSEVFELPFMVNTSEKASPALWDYVQKNSLDEFKGTKVLFMHLHDGAQLQFGSKAVKSLEDLKGLKIRAATRLNGKMLEALGAIPVQMPVPAAPEAVAKGVVDGLSLPWEVMTPYKMQEITKFHTETAPGLAKISNTIFVFAMNQAKYDGLPADLKKVIDNNSGRETSVWAGKVFDATTVASRKIAQDRHNTFITISADEYKRWQKATENVDDDWIKEANGRGANGKALLDDAKALLKKYQ